MKIEQHSTTAKRSYRMSARAAAVAATGQRILQAFADLYMERWLEDLTLDEVASRAGVTVQTVLRRFGSKAGLIRAAGEALYQQVSHQRGQAPVGDIAGAVANLVDHYEDTGDLMIRTLAQEGRHEVLRDFAELGRVFHRAWVEATFASLLDDRTPQQRDDTLTRLAVVTDLYVWKILRRDMGLEREQAQRHITQMVSAAIG